ncbi:hypothetical protein DOTSEDRAFT_156921 [Dothistroma septosporum NZE10]|uniref:Uncharacterized protein n=1 Tax=Dothistroma septosporum (strain NZE10 / CBS 128990) TaxID=675120 RepID=N1PGT9_DOTSN|nr:hypothetical protein DOTSEDRAFT_156921 [Dothistroma septosporum NZE10]
MCTARARGRSCTAGEMASPSENPPLLTTNIAPAHPPTPSFPHTSTHPAFIIFTLSTLLAHPRPPYPKRYRRRQALLIRTIGEVVQWQDRRALRQAKACQLGAREFDALLLQLFFASCDIQMAPFGESHHQCKVIMSVHVCMHGNPR